MLYNVIYHVIQKNFPSYILENTEAHPIEQ